MTGEGRSLSRSSSAEMSGCSQCGHRSHPLAACYELRGGDRCSCQEALKLVKPCPICGQQPYPGHEHPASDLLAAMGCSTGRSLLTCTQQAGGGWLTRRSYEKHVKKCEVCRDWQRRP